MNIAAKPVTTARTAIQNVLCHDENAGEPTTTKEEESEGAACLVLSAAESPGDDGALPHTAGPVVRLAGWGLAGPGRVAEAVTAALQAAGLDRDEVRRLPDPAEVLGRAAAAGPAFACAAAFAAIARGEARSLLVVDPGEGSASAAVVLTADPATRRHG